MKEYAEITRCGNCNFGNPASEMWTGTFAEDGVRCSIYNSVMDSDGFCSAGIQRDRDKNLYDELPGMQRSDFLLQLAEECTELAKESQKLLRIRNGRSVTPCNAGEQLLFLQDEIGDVLNLIECVIATENLSRSAIDKVRTEKMKRWKRRQQNGLLDEHDIASGIIYDIQGE